SRCAGEGLIGTLLPKAGEEALLPFTGEGARRADEGARAQRSVPLMLPGRATAARFARTLIRRFAPPSPASQEKGWFRTLLPVTGKQALVPLRRRRADRDVAAEGWGRSPSPASQEKGCFRMKRQEPDGEGLLRRETASGWLRTRPNEKR